MQKYIPNDNLCVCCGAIIPEGRTVCPNCEAGNGSANNCKTTNEDGRKNAEKHVKGKIRRKQKRREQ